MRWSTSACRLPCGSGWGTSPLDEAYRTLDFPTRRRSCGSWPASLDELIYRRERRPCTGASARRRWPRRSRVRGPPEPLAASTSHRAGDGRSAERAAEGRSDCLSGPRGPGGRPGGLDHHPLDAPRQSRGRNSSSTCSTTSPPGHRGGQGPPAAGPRRNRPGPAQAVKPVAAAGGEVSAASLVEPRRILGYATGRDWRASPTVIPSSTAGVVVLGEHVTLDRVPAWSTPRRPRAGGLRRRHPVRPRHLQPGPRRRARARRCSRPSFAG